MHDGMSVTEYAVLGLLSFGERSGYELDQLANRSIGKFWRPAKSKIYDVLPRLVERGLATAAEHAQERRPDKIVYHLTPPGEEALRAWVNDPDVVMGIARDGLLLKLFFGALGDIEALEGLIRGRKERAETRVAELEAIEQTIDREEDFFPYLTLLHGLEDARSTIIWAEDVLKLLLHRRTGVAHENR